MLKKLSLFAGFKSAIAKTAFFLQFNELVLQTKSLKTGVSIKKK